MARVRVITFVVFLHLTSTCFCQSWIQWKQKGDKACQQYDVAAAAGYFEKALSNLPDDSLKQDSLMVKLSDMYTICMKFDKAAPLLKTIMLNYAGKKGSSEYIHALTNLGLIHLYKEETDTAYYLFNEADSLINISFDHQHFLYAENRMALSRLYIETAKMDSALFAISEASSIYSADKDKYLPEYTLALSTTGRIYQQIGDIRKAKDYLYKSANEFKNFLLTYHPYGMESMLNYWEFFAMTGQYDKAALGYYSLAIIIYAKLGDNNPLFINTYNNQGFLSLRTGKFADACTKFKKALNLLEKQGVGKSIYYFITKNNLGLAYLSDKQYKMADSVLSAAQEMARMKWGENHYLYGVVMYNKGLLLNITGHIKEAANSFIAAGKIYKTQLLDNITGLSEREQLSTYYTSEPSFQVLPSFAHQHKIFTDSTVTNSIFEEQSFLKGLISFNQQKLLNIVRKSTDKNVIQQFNNWVSTRQQLSAAYSINKPKLYTDSLLLQANLAERDIMSRSGAFSKYQSSLGTSCRDIAKQLKDGEAAIEFIRYRLFTDTWTDSIFYSALLIEPGSNAPVFIDLCTEQQLKSVLLPYYFDNGLHKSLSDMYIDPLLRHTGKKYASDSLYNLVWKPFEACLLDKSTIYISPTGLLNLIAYPALPYRSKQLLLNRYTIRRFQHLSSLLVKDTTVVASSDNIAIWGGINYDSNNTIAGENKPAKNMIRGNGEPKQGNWQSLPFSLSEAVNISKAFKSKGKNVVLYKDAKATKESFTTAIISRPSFLHIATHGFYKKDTTNEVLDVPFSWSYNVVKNREPLLRSGLVFAGANKPFLADSSLQSHTGILTSYDIASMSLENVKLATLSACETALGDIESGEGVFGLQRSLKVAGVDKMILALWNVPDRQASGFMTLFYKSLLSGLSIPDAFVFTQKKMSKTDTPRYWAGFILVE